MTAAGFGYWAASVAFALSTFVLGVHLGRAETEALDMRDVVLPIIAFLAGAATALAAGADFMM